MNATLWTIRLASLCYAVALMARLQHRRYVARFMWTGGLILYIAHVICAFQFVHDWSHDKAYIETARQTNQLFHIKWGGGLWFNYLFTLVWLVDVIWLWTRPQGYENRAKWIRWSIDGFLLFMFFNGAIIFASGWTRWIGLAFLGVLMVTAYQRRSRF